MQTWKHTEPKTHTPGLVSIMIVANDLDTAMTTDYHDADRMARAFVVGARLFRKGEGLGGRAMRLYRGTAVRDITPVVLTD